MKIDAIFAMSINGYITNGSDPDVTKWTSKEDKAHFNSFKDKYDLHIMGSTTFEAMRQVLKNREGLLRIIITSNPDKYRRLMQHGKLEFYSGELGSLVSQLKERGYDQALLLGGAQTFGSFLRAGFVNKLYLTVEPIIFEDGTLLANGQPGASLSLESSSRLNDQGSLLNIYSCII